MARKAQEKEEHKQRSMEGQRARNERDTLVRAQCDVVWGRSWL